MSVEFKRVSSKRAEGANPFYTENIAKGWCRVPEHREGSGFQNKISRQEHTDMKSTKVQFSSVQSLSCVRLFATP